jgi:hypothetical protein
VRARRLTRRARAIAAATAVALIVIVVVVPNLASGQTGSARTAKPTAATTVPARTPKIYGLVMLDHTRLATGRMIRGRIVFHNRTHHKKVLYKTCKADGLWAVMVTGKVTAAPANGAVACPGTKVIVRPGTTRWRFHVEARYAECSQGDGSPRCLRHSRHLMPPLPTGDYRVEFMPGSTWTPLTKHTTIHGVHVYPAAITLTH